MKLIYIIILIIIVVACNETNYQTKVIDFNSIDSSQINKIEDSSLKVIVGAMISPKETFYLYNDLFKYISDTLGLSIKFYQRKTYLETNELIKHNIVDIGIICTGAYVKNKENCELISTPVINNLPYYQSYIIVNSEQNIKNFSDLKNKSFAFTDMLSNTGKMYPEKVILKKFKTTSEKFFRSIIYSGSHDISIQLVSKGIVSGAAVDGLIFDFIKNTNPTLVKNITIIEKSEYFGAPPIVCSKKLDNALKLKIKNILINMHKDTLGRKILKKLMIDKFIMPNDSLYKNVFVNCEK